MKNKKNRQLLRSLLIITVGLLPFLAMAQPPEGPGNPDVPIDGGLGLLLAAGAAYGVKKYRDGKKKENEQEMK